MTLIKFNSGGFSALKMTFILVFAAFALIACGKSSGNGSKSTSILGAGPLSLQAGAQTSAEALGFSIEEFAESYPDKSQSGSLTLNVLGRDEKGHVQIAIDAVDAIGYKCALLHLHYDNTKYTPAAVHQGAFLPGAIFLGVTSLPDFVPVGAVLPNPGEREGVTGTGRIAVVTFEEKPFSMPRNLSAVPLNVENRISQASIVDDTIGKLATISFVEKNLGDYDLSMDVAIPDITPIAVRYMQIPTSMDPTVDPAAVVDGDMSGEVGISDITPIAVNYLNVVSAYAVKWGYFDEAGGSNVIVGDLPNLTETGAPYSISRDYSGNGLRPRYTYTFDYGANPQYDGADAENLRFWIRPYGAGEYGIEGGPFSTQVSGGGDTTPPVWQTGFGIISSSYNIDNSEINITFGVATDANTPPVKYAAYWQTGTELVYAGARADNRFVILDTSGQTESPLTATLTAADGLPIGEVISIGVHARDSAIPFNETAELSPHPFNPGGLDWIVTSPGGGGEDTAPVWQTTQGISEAQPGNTTVTVGWGNAFHPEGTVTYEIYWLEGDYESGATGNPPAFFATANHETATGNFQHTITGMTNGTEYSFGVRARSPRGMYDTNTKVLTATPMDSVFPFAVPADGLYDVGVIATDSDLDLTPYDNAPVIVYTTGADNLLGLCYYDGTDWIHEIISTSARFDHPSIELVGSNILVSAYNRTTLSLELYTGDVNGQNWSMEVVDNVGIPGKGFQFCWTSSMEYYEPTDMIGVVYMAGVGDQFESTSNSILKYSFRSGAQAWTTEIIQGEAGNSYHCPGASFVFTPDGTPSAAYTFGQYSWNDTMYNTFVYYGVRQDGIWDVEMVPGNWKANQPIGLTYNTVTDQPFITLGRDREVEPYPTVTMDILDSVVAWKDAEGLWTDQILEFGAGFFDIGSAVFWAEMAGADPVIGFNAAGQGFVYYSFIHIDGDLSEEGMTVHSYLTEVTFNGVDWNAPFRIDDSDEGCSAINMAIDVAEARVTFSKIGAPYWTMFDVPRINQFPEGDLVYWQF